VVHRSGRQHPFGDSARLTGRRRRRRQGAIKTVSVAVGEAGIGGLPSWGAPSLPWFRAPGRSWRSARCPQGGTRRRRVRPTRRTGNASHPRWRFSGQERPGRGSAQAVSLPGVPAGDPGRHASSGGLAGPRRCRRTMGERGRRGPAALAPVLLAPLVDPRRCGRPVAARNDVGGRGLARQSDALGVLFEVRVIG